MEKVTAYKTTDGKLFFNSMNSSDALRIISEHAEELVDLLK